MKSLHLNGYLGDSVRLGIALEWEGVAFVPGTEWGLIFTLKRSANEEDEAAVVQKASGVGIEAVESTAMVELVHEDTVDEAPGVLTWDVQAQSTVTGKVRTVAVGNFTLFRDRTRKLQTSVPIHTTEVPAPFAGELPGWLEGLDSVAVTEDDELEVTVGGVVFWIPMNRR